MGSELDITTQEIDLWLIVESSLKTFFWYGVLVRKVNSI